MKRKQNIVNVQSNANYDIGNENINKTEVIKSNLCDFNDAYILVIGNITIIGHQGTQIAFKNCTPFSNCITKTDETTIADADGLDLVMPMYGLVEYVWFYSKDEATTFDADIANNNYFESKKLNY